MHKFCFALVGVFIFCGGFSWANVDFEQKCQEIAEEMRGELIKITQKQNADKNISSEDLSLKEKVDSVLIFNAQVSMGILIQSLMSKISPSKFEGEIPNEIDTYYALAHRKKMCMTAAIHMGYSLEKSKRNIMAAFAISKDDKFREEIRKILVALGDWDKKLINLAIDPEAHEKSKAHYQKFASYWEAVKEFKKARKKKFQDYKNSNLQT